ncbi:MAG: F0F1 ATP synthase subunit B [Candidatus Omnitrophota bacterium]|nr:F0F1 ATP synthase subunit B [Candidatus Omnitrophota bacterium]
MELLRLLSTNEIVAQVISFLILFFILRAFAWKKILLLLDARREKIASEFQKIEEAKEEISKLKSDYNEKLERIDELAQVKIQEAVSQARHIAQEIREKAAADSRIILKKAEENIELELSKAKEVLKDKVIDLTIGATEYIIKEKLTSEKDKKLISEFLDELDEVK